MSKNLKDIVEEGFAKLSSLASKRQEILSRCDRLAEGIDGASGKLAVGKIETIEGASQEDMNAHVSRSKEALQQALGQIIEDNERFLASVKEHLELRIERMTKELNHTQEWTVASASERFDSLIRPLEREKEAGTTDLRFEAVKLISELEAACKRSQSAFHEAQAEIGGRLSSSEHELTGELQIEYKKLIEEAEKKRHLVTQSLEQLYSHQAEQLSTLTEDLNEQLDAAVKENIKSVKQMNKESEESLATIRNDVVTVAVAEIVSLSQESFSELEASYEFSHHELSEKLTELRGQTNKLLEQVKESLLTAEKDVRVRAEELTTKLKEEPEGLSGKDKDSPLEELLSDFGRQFDSINNEYKNQLNDLVKIQVERLGNLSGSAEGAFLTSAQALNTELKQMIRMHQQTWSDREQDILKRISKLEKETNETLSLVSGSGDGGMVTGEEG